MSAVLKYFLAEEGDERFRSEFEDLIRDRIRVCAVFEFNEHTVTFDRETWKVEVWFRYGDPEVSIEVFGVDEFMIAIRQRRQ